MKPTKFSLKYSVFKRPGSLGEFKDKLRKEDQDSVFIFPEMTWYIGMAFPSEKQPYWRVFLNPGEGLRDFKKRRFRVGHNYKQPCETLEKIVRVGEELEEDNFKVKIGIGSFIIQCYTLQELKENRETVERDMYIDNLACSGI